MLCGYRPLPDFGIFIHDGGTCSIQAMAIGSLGLNSRDAKTKNRFSDDCRKFGDSFVQRANSAWHCPMISRSPARTLVVCHTCLCLIGVISCLRSVSPSFVSIQRWLSGILTKGGIRWPARLGNAKDGQLYSLAEEFDGRH